MDLELVRPRIAEDPGTQLVKNHGIHLPNHPFRLWGLTPATPSRRAACCGSMRLRLRVSVCNRGTITWSRRLVPGPNRWS